MHQNGAGVPVYNTFSDIYIKKILKIYLPWSEKFHKSVLKAPKTQSSSDWVFKYPPIKQEKQLRLSFLTVMWQHLSANQSLVHFLGSQISSTVEALQKNGAKSKTKVFHLHILYAIIIKWCKVAKSFLYIFISTELFLHVMVQCLIKSKIFVSQKQSRPLTLNLSWWMHMQECRLSTGGRMRPISSHRYKRSAKASMTTAAWTLGIPFPSELTRTGPVSFYSCSESPQQLSNMENIVFIWMVFGLLHFSNIKRQIKEK